MTDTPKGTTPKVEETGNDAQQEHHDKVPEAAEDIEHTLRRLNAEKAKKREKNPGLYL